MTEETLKEPRKDGAVAALSLVLFAAAFFAHGGKIVALWSPVSAGLLLTAFLLLRRRPVFLLPSFLPGVLGFLGWGFLATLSSPSPLTSLWTMSKIGSVAAFGVVAWFCWGEKANKIFRGLVMAAALAQSLLVFSSPLFGRPILLLPGNPHYMGLWMTVGCLLGLNALVAPDISKRLRWTFAGITVFLAAATFWLPSRAGTIALVVGASFFLGRRFGRKALLSWLLFVLLLAWLFVGSLERLLTRSGDPLAWKRLDIWRAAVTGLSIHPYVGWGPGQFETLYQGCRPPQTDLPVWYGVTTAFAHNDYLQLATECGLPAAVFLLWGLACFFFYNRPRDGPALAAHAAVLAIGVFCLFNFPMFLPVNGLLAAGLLVQGETRTEKFRLALSPRLGSFFRRTILTLTALFAVSAGAVFLIELPATAGVRSLSRYRLWNPASLLEQADAFLHSADKKDVHPESAERLLRRIVLFDRSNAKAWRDLSHLLLMHRADPDLETARRALAKALFWHPTEATWYLELSQLFERMGDLPKAREAAHAALRLEPKFLPAKQQIGRILWAMGEPRQGERWLAGVLRDTLSKRPATRYSSSYSRFVLRGTTPNAIRRDLARCQMAQNKYDAALRTLLQNKNDRSPGQAVLESDVLYQLGRDAEAKKRLELALKARPRDQFLLKRLELLQNKTSPRRR
ncbi:MAG TPA: O-antigen ligase family protein [Elusimicrobiota bacterium]|nr:O-antigen ligase family protein [Elusimicrobiota bacterium]